MGSCVGWWRGKPDIEKTFHNIWVASHLTFPPAINRMLLIKTRPQKIGLERKWFRSVDHEKIASVKKQNSQSLTRAWKLGTPLSIKWVNEWINEQTSIQKDIIIGCLLCVGTVSWMWIQNQMSLRNAKCPQEVYTSVWSQNIGDHGHPQWRAPHCCLVLTWNTSKKEITTGLIGRSWLAKERIEAAAHAKSWHPVGTLPGAAHEQSEAVVGQHRGLNQTGSHRWDKR